MHISLLLFRIYNSSFLLIVIFVGGVAHADLRVGFTFTQLLTVVVAAFLLRSLLFD
jgi:hypothetical protein